MQTLYFFPLFLTLYVSKLGRKNWTYEVFVSSFSSQIILFFAETGGMSDVKKEELDRKRMQRKDNKKKVFLKNEINLGQERHFDCSRFHHPALWPPLLTIEVEHKQPLL